MIDRDYAAALTLRLSGLLGRPAETPALEAVAQAIAEAARDPDHARRIVDHWLKHNRMFPLPFDIHQTAAAVREPERNSGAETRPRCRLCGGTGFVIEHYLITWNHGPNQTCYRTTELITREQAEDLREKVAGWPMQAVVTGARRCACRHLGDSDE